MKYTMTSQHGSSCPICGAHLGGPWRTCSELCDFLFEAEGVMAVDEVETEVAPLTRRAAKKAAMAKAPRAA